MTPSSVRDVTFPSPFWGILFPYFIIHFTLSLREITERKSRKTWFCPALPLEKNMWMFPMSTLWNTALKESLETEHACTGDIIWMKHVLMPRYTISLLLYSYGTYLRDMQCEYSYLKAMECAFVTNDTNSPKVKIMKCILMRQLKFKIISIKQPWRMPCWYVFILFS